jgi:hypothetical protein
MLLALYVRFLVLGDQSHHCGSTVPSGAVPMSRMSGASARDFVPKPAPWIDISCPWLTGMAAFVGRPASLSAAAACSGACEQLERVALASPVRNSLRFSAASPRKTDPGGSVPRREGNY